MGPTNTAMRANQRKRRSDETSVPGGEGGREPLVRRWARVLRAFYVDVVIVYALLLLAWEIVVRVSNVPVYLLASPSAIAEALVRGVSSGALVSATWATLQESLLGLAFGVIVGFLVAALLNEFKFAHRIVYPLIIMLQSLPKIAVAPLLIIWIGYGMSSKVLLSALVVFFPILVNTMSGLRAYDRDLFELFRSIKATRWQIFLRLKVPSCVPHFMAGLRIGWIFAMLGAIVAEFLGAGEGLGYTIMQGQFLLDTAGVFAALAILAAIGLVGEQLIDFAAGKLVFWSSASQLETNVP